MSTTVVHESSETSTYILSSSASSIAASPLTTLGANRLVVLSVFYYNTTTPGGVTSLSSSSTWTPISSISGYIGLQTLCTVVPVAGTVAVTVNYPAPTGGSTTEILVMLDAFYLTAGTSQAPIFTWQTSALLGDVSGSGSDSITTHAPNDQVLAYIGAYGSSPSLSPGSGYTTTNNAATGTMTVLGELANNNTPTSGTSVAATFSLGGPPTQCAMGIMTLNAPQAASTGDWFVMF